MFVGLLCFIMYFYMVRQKELTTLGGVGFINLCGGCYRIIAYLLKIK